MRAVIIGIVSATVMFCGMTFAGKVSGRDVVKPSLTGSFLLGYSGGAGAQLGLIILDIAPSFPFATRLGIGYLRIDPGKPAEARINFINDATNGTPEESGHMWDFRLDFMYPLQLLDQRRIYAVIGPRHSRFTGTFEYVGGNEKFDVTTNEWGIGAGFETYFFMTRRIELVLTAGLDKYFRSTLSGHDTSYSPDGENVNGRDGYDYDTADDAINQATIEARLMMGFAYRF